MASWRFHRCFLENRPSSNPLQDDPRQSNIPDDDPCRKYPGQRIWRWNGKNYRRSQGNETRIWKTKTSISGFRILAGSRSRKNRAPDAAVGRSKHEFFSSRRRLTLSSFFLIASQDLLTEYSFHDFLGSTAVEDLLLQLGATVLVFPSTVCLGQASRTIQKPSRSWIFSYFAHDCFAEDENPRRYCWENWP